MQAVQPWLISKSQQPSQQRGAESAPAEMKRAAVHRLADGSAVEIEQDEVRIVDDRQRLLVRYRDGHAEICAPRGDVTFLAPHGHVKLEAGKDVTMQSRRDLHLGAGRRVIARADEATELRLEPSGAELSAARLDVNATRGRFALRRAELIADEIDTRARQWLQQVERLEIVAERITERAESVWREVSDVIDTRVGRVRTRVAGALQVRSKRTVMVSEQETSIDGERILLG